MIPYFVNQDYEGNAIYYPECIYSSEELHNMLNENTQKFLDLVKPKIEQFLGKSKLCSFVETSIVYNESMPKRQFDSFPIEQKLIDYFSVNKEQHNIHLFIDKFVASSYLGDEYEEKIDAMMSDLRKHFASIRFYRRFLQECFVHADGDNTLSDYLSKNRLDD